MLGIGQTKFYNLVGGWARNHQIGKGARPPDAIVEQHGSPHSAPHEHPDQGEQTRTDAAVTGQEIAINSHFLDAYDLSRTESWRRGWRPLKWNMYMIIINLIYFMIE